MCSTEETLELLSMLIANDKEEEAKLDDEQKNIGKSLEEITAILTNYETWSKARKSLEKSKSDLSEAIAALEILKANLQSEEANKPKIEDIRKKIIGDAKVITHRPADDIAPEFDAMKEKYASIVKCDEDVLSCALFEQVAVKFLESRNAPKEQDEVVEFEVVIG